MKILKKLIILSFLATMITGCTKEPENDYLGNLNVSYTLKMNGGEVDKAKFEFFYGRALTKYMNQVYEAFGEDYTSVLSFNIEKDINELKDQDCTVEGFKDKSWEYYFANKAKNDFQEVEALVKAAKADGYKVNKDDSKKAKSDFATIKEYCKNNDIKLEDYLHSMFGLDATKETMIENYENIELATRYAANLLKEPTEKQIQAAYKKHQDEIDIIDIRYFAFSKDNKAEAEEFAKKATSETAFKSLAVEYASDDKKNLYQENDLTLRRNLVKEVLPEYLQKALYDQKFAPNSVKVVKGNNSYDVVMLVNRTKPEYRQANISTIYLDARESDSDTLTTDKMAVCKNFADNLLKDFVNNTDKSIKKFHEYNSKYADDKNNQGDYDNVSKEDSTVQIADWVFEGNRKYGDVKVLPSTYGYTIVYFKEYGEVDYYQKAKKLAKDDLYDQKLNKLKKDVKVVLE